MGKVKAIVLIAVVLMGAIALYSLGGMVTPLSFEPTTPVHAYDGLTTTWHSVTYHDEPYPATVAGPAVTIDPPLGAGGPDDPWGLADPTGIIGEVTQPFILQDEVIEYDKEYENETRADGNEDVQIWKTYEVPLRFNVEIRTGGTGINSISQVSFFLNIVENTFSVFSSADAAAAYILWVRTTGVDRVADGHTCEMIPLTTGFSFMLHDARTGDELGDTAPFPGHDGLNVENLNRFKNINIEFNMLDMKPLWDIWTNTRSDAQVWFELEVRVLLVGYWNRVLPPHETGASDPDPEPEDQIWLVVLILLALVGVVGSVFIIVRLGGRFHPILLLFFVAVCWIPLVLWVSMDIVGKLQELLGGV